MSAAQREKDFVESLDKCFAKIQKDEEFDLVQYKKSYVTLIDDKPLALKELEYLVDFLKVPKEEMGEELEDPCLEACFVCDALFEKNQGVAIKVPFCGHRAHIECIRRDSTGYCRLCGNGIRSSLFSLLRTQKQTELAKQQAQVEDDDANLEITVPQIVDATL